MSAVIRDDDIIQSIADALQFIACYHPADYIRHLAAAHAREQSPAARDAIGQILLNSRLAALGHRPMCQDTGIVNAFVRVGMGVRIATTRPIEALVDEGVRQAYLDPANPLRASIIRDSLFARLNTRDNTPAVTHTSVVPGDRVAITVMAKGGGSENKSRFAMLNPSDDLVRWMIDTVETLRAGWCPPGMIGLGVGGSAENAMMMAKESLFEPIDMGELLARGPANAEEELRIKLYEAINALGIGAQGLGGLTTGVDVKLRTFPTHSASKPVGLIPQCAANRHVTFALDGSGPAIFTPPALADWPQITLDHSAHAARRVDLDALSADEVMTWKPGQTLLLSGKMLTGRDAAHKRMVDLIAGGTPLPVDLRGRAIYYVGPVDAVGDEVIGPAGPTTASRMDAFTELLLAKTGLMVMIGKAERGPLALEAIARHKAAYLIAVGGAAILVSQAIRAARVVAFADLGIEAIYEFTIEDMPVTVAVDATGQSIHKLVPAHWRQRIHESKQISLTAAI